MSEGWIRPSCKRGVAPGEKYCDHGGAKTRQPDSSELQKKYNELAQKLSQQGGCAGCNYGASPCSCFTSSVDAIATKYVG